MARLFNDAANQSGATGVAVVAAPPFTMGTWVYMTDDTGNHPIMTIDNFASLTIGWSINGTAGPGRRIGYSGRGVGLFFVLTTTSWTVNAWHHACVVSAAANAHAVFLDGGGKATSAVNVVAAGIDDLLLGLNERRNEWLAGRLAESAVWNAALTDAEVAILAAGYSPLFVRPQSLVAYWPLFGRLSPEIDPVGGFDMTLVNGPTQAPHPRIIYPTRQVLSFPPSAVAPAFLAERGVLRGAWRGIYRGM